MAKFYQHMQPGDTLGKITRLRYIDDISDDELILYVFEDKTKCSEDFIAEINSTEAFNGNYVMTELTDPLNCWKFEVKEINLNKSKKVLGSDGQEYELPDPGISVNGEHISLGLNDDGTPKTISNNILNGKRTDATPPRIIKNKVVEPKENYLLSLHPELLTNKKENNYVNNLLSDSLHRKNNIPDNKINENNMTDNISIEKPVFKKSNNPITTNIVETVKHASITINLDDITNSEYDNIHIILHGKQEDLTVDEFINKLTSVKEQEILIKEETQVPVKLHENEDILITNMIDRSKKKECTIGVDINLELPPKEVYKTIKDVYPEGMAENFVSSIAKRMDINTLKDALTLGLTAYYENHNVADK